MQLIKSSTAVTQEIAVITSHTGAAVKDIIRVIKDRNPNVDVLIVP